jgi:hypothetical protein
MFSNVCIAPVLPFLAVSRNVYSVSGANETNIPVCYVYPSTGVIPAPDQVGGKLQPESITYGDACSGAGSKVRDGPRLAPG